MALANATTTRAQDTHGHAVVPSGDGTYGRRATFVVTVGNSDTYETNGHAVNCNSGVGWNAISYVENAYYQPATNSAARLHVSVTHVSNAAAVRFKLTSITNSGAELANATAVEEGAKIVLVLVGKPA